MTARALALPLALGLAGCNNVQSALAPQGDGASLIAQLSWLLFLLCAAISVAVIAAVWVAVFGPAKIRKRLADIRVIVGGGIIFPVVVLTALLVYDLWLLRADIAHVTGRDSRIEVVGEQWWWRVAYLDGDNRIASANEIRIPAGQPVEFALKSADVIHSFWIPALGGKVDMIPGRTTQLRLTARQSGIFRGQCAEYCGGAHAHMAIEVIAMPQDEYARWLAAQAAPAVEPADEAGRKGKALFLAAGCGACHAVRGSGADGSIGPDLTHIGGRRSIGTDTMPMTPANLSRFIVDGQHLKPGNKMPPFRIFTQDELGALSHYLGGLR
jgi:cytochrome c oxidase subunit II